MYGITLIGINKRYAQNLKPPFRGRCASTPEVSRAGSVLSRLGNVARVMAMAILCWSFSLQYARLYPTQSNFFRKFCLKRLSQQSLDSAIWVKFLRFVMLRKRIEVMTKKVLKLLRNFAVPSRASLMILVSWSSG